MKKEKVFIAENPTEEAQQKHNVLTAFEVCEKAAKIVKNFGIPVSRDTVKDCLTLKKTIRQVAADDTEEWIGEGKSRFAKYAAVEAFDNDTHLRAELEKMLADIEASDTRAAERTAKANALRAEYDEMLARIYGLFHVGRRDISTGELLQYIEVKDGVISLPKDLEERIKADTSTYATTERGMKAYYLHKEICDKLNALADLMKNVPRYEFAAELDKLFYQSEEGTIQATPIDYDLFT